MPPGGLRAASAVRPRPSRADQLVAALDRQHVVHASSEWVIYVLGVHTDGPDLWIQISPDELGGNDLVLHFLPESTVEDALSTLQTVTFSESDHPQIIEVGPRS